MAQSNWKSVKTFGLSSLLPLFTALAIELFSSLQVIVNEVDVFPSSLGFGAALLQALNVAVTTPRFWIIAAVLTSLNGLHLAYQHVFKQQIRASWLRYLGSLDIALIVLLIAWVWIMTSMFVFNPDPMRSQPLEPKFDIGLMVQQWTLTLDYFWQFTVMAAVVFIYYWMNRYQFIRKVLQCHGVYIYLLSSILWLLITYPIFALLILQLPLNIPEQTLLPSEDHNIFAGMNLFTAATVWALSTPFILAFERQQNAKEVAELQQEKVEAELKMLQQQVNPHFLFNMLNGLYALCLTGSSNAAPMLLKLSDLLRYLVYQGQNDRVALSEELSYLQNYVELQQMRIGHRCRVNWTINVKDEGINIAPMLLIMLVENAFKHGIEPNPQMGDIEIDAKVVKESEFVFRCCNSVASTSTPKLTSGIGLKNLRRRLELTYGSQHNLRSEQSGSRWIAELRITL